MTYESGFVAVKVTDDQGTLMISLRIHPKDIMGLSHEMDAGRIKLLEV